MKTQRLTTVLVGTLILLVLGVVLDGRRAEASAVPQVLRARTIELVDARGLRRASLKVEPQGDVVFRLFDRRGTIRVKLGASENGSGLVLNDESTAPGVHVLATRERTMVAVQRGEQRRELAP
jgi:hypothetical protein